MIVKFYHPSKIGNRKIADKKRLESLHSVARKFCTEFGGATVRNSEGFYLDSKGRIIIEDIKIVSSNIKKLSSKQRSEILELALDVKNSLRQESIMVEFGNQAEFI